MEIVVLNKHVERLSSNQAFIDEFIDQQVLKQLEQCVDISPKSLKSGAAGGLQQAEIRKI